MSNHYSLIYYLHITATFSTHPLNWVSNVEMPMADNALYRPLKLRIQPDSNPQNVEQFEVLQIAETIPI